MTLDELEKLARSCDGFALSMTTRQFARALLAVLPVVRAAEAWREAAPYNREDRWYNDQIENAIDTMRAALAKEQG